MKPIFTLLAICMIHLTMAQTHSDHLSIRNSLAMWDSIRGTWVYNAMQAIHSKLPVPDRTFPEDLTPFELLSLAPRGNREDLQAALDQVISPDGFTQLMSSLVEATFCSSSQGRSYGDPHIVTYDNTSYSFQTVGEFVLSKRGESFEVQARQKPQSEDFSLNTAVAMQLYNDRIAYYAEDIPDGSGTPLWLNGQPLKLEGRTYYLPSGGTLRLIGRNYIISGPMGEKVIIENRGGSMKFINLTVNYPECSSTPGNGLLGNANRDRQDDFQVDPNIGTNTNGLVGFMGMNSPEFSSMSQDIEQRYQIQIIKEFAEIHRVTPTTTLFQYRPGLNTQFYTDRTFPRFIRTFNSIPTNNQNAARDRCRQMGVSEAEMNGCIFDAYYLNLPPNPVPTPPPATEGVVLNKLRHPMVNSNTVAPSKFPVNDAQPLPTKPVESNSKPSTYEPERKPDIEPAKPTIHFEVPEIKTPSEPVYTPQPKPASPAPDHTPAPKNPPAAVPSKGKGR